MSSRTTIVRRKSINSKRHGGGGGRRINQVHAATEKPRKENCGNEELDSGLQSGTREREAKAKTICTTVRKPLGPSTSVLSVCWKKSGPKVKQAGARKKWRPQHWPPRRRRQRTMEDAERSKVI